MMPGHYEYLHDRPSIAVDNINGISDTVVAVLCHSMVPSVHRFDSR
jgi:hypothetical protein